MKIEKKVLGTQERCYCTSHVTIDNELYVLLASEAEQGGCFAFTGENFSKRETVWDNAGGTMSIIEIPRSNGQFLAVQNFFPGFQSEKAKIVWGKRNSDGSWTTRDVLHLPFVHRFDILERNGALYFIGCVLCRSKKERNDWSDPGYVAAGILPDSFEHGETIEVTEILGGLVKNHGYWHDETSGIQKGYVTCDSGIYVFTPPESVNGNWDIRHILERPVSDVAVVDLDGDGLCELVTVEPFHGNALHVYHADQAGWKTVYTYDHPMEFAHAVWGGHVLGEPMAIIGIRRMDCELFMLQYAQGKYAVSYIEKGVGTSNVALVTQQNRAVLIAANHTVNQQAVYLLTK